MPPPPHTHLHLGINDIIPLHIASVLVNLIVILLTCTGAVLESSWVAVRLCLRCTWPHMICCIPLVTTWAGDTAGSATFRAEQS